MTDASMTDRRRPIRVLFVCSHNSARSQMAEALLKRKGGDDFEVYSAGTEPGTVRPMTLQVLEEAGLETSGLRAKAVSEFFGQAFDYVITVCDQAREACPVFPGAGDSLHWGYDDPSEATGTDEERLAVFRRVFLEISLRLEQFVPIALREHGRSPIPAAT